MSLIVSYGSDTGKLILDPASLSPRLVLRRGDLFRLPAFSRGIEVVSGIAWVTVKDRDIVLTAGEKLVLPAGKDTVLISALGHHPLIVEVLQNVAEN